MSSITSIALALLGALIKSPVPSWVYWAFAVACFLVASYQVWKKEALQQPVLALRLLNEDCGWFLHWYRELAQNHPNQTGRPLASSSWPAFGAQWDEVHCNLYALAMQMHWFLMKAEKTWQEMGWTDSPILYRTGKSQTTLMAHLIGDLEGFSKGLEQKISSLESGRSK